MAEAILIEIGTKIIEKLGSAAFKKLKSLKDLESKIQKLRDIKSIIEDELHKFDPYEVRTDPQGYKIKRLRCVYDDLVRFFEKLETRNQLVARIKTDGEVNALMKELQSIANDYVQCKSIVSLSSGGNQNSSITSANETSLFLRSHVFIGRDGDKENIVYSVICNSSNYDQIVAIVGVGGQGKTTLAQFVCQDDRVKGSFNQLLWVHLTPESSNIKEIYQRMIKRATGQEPVSSDLEQLQRQVLGLINGKKCLLVLDNVYYYENLRDDSEELSAILEQGDFWSNGGRILITSRSKKVAEYMGSFKVYELHDLAEDDCWRLLRHYANKDDNKDSAVEAVGKEIVRICPKVPLVLKILGRNLGYKDISYWKRFKNNLESIPTLYIGPPSSYLKQQELIEQTLKLCYDQLDYNLKRCAAFCSLFPKGHLYDKNYMVHNWIALGFVESRDPPSLQDVGLAYVLELTERAIFEKSYTFEFFKMHDVMHDLMYFIGKIEHQMIDSETTYLVEGVRHVSLNMGHLRWDVLLSSTCDKQALESILLISSSWGDNRDHGLRLGSEIDTLILACPNLKILEIREQGIEKVPSRIGKLTHMRHLDLSWNRFGKLPKEIKNLVNLSTLNLSNCRYLKKLPQEMEKLVNLSSLDLSWCEQLHELPWKMEKLVNLFSLDLAYCWSLKELPRDFGNLVNLTHLWVKGSGLRCMPKGFKNLTKLETLDMFVVGENSRSSRGSSKAEVGATLEELGHLNNLKGDLRIKLGEESKYIMSEAGNAHLERKSKLSGIYTQTGCLGEYHEFLKGIQLDREDWKELFANNYGGERLPMWITDGQFHKRFPKLSTVHLQHDVSFMFAPILIGNDDKFFRYTGSVGNAEGDVLEWVTRISRLNGQSKMEAMHLSFITRRDGLTPIHLRDQTFHDDHFNIREEFREEDNLRGNLFSLVWIPNCEGEGFRRKQNGRDIFYFSLGASPVAYSQINLGLLEGW